MVSKFPVILWPLDQFQPPVWRLVYKYPSSLPFFSEACSTLLLMTFPGLIPSFSHDLVENSLILIFYPAELGRRRLEVVIQFYERKSK
jgi:hypothetical protein